MLGALPQPVHTVIVAGTRGANSAKISNGKGPMAQATTDRVLKAPRLYPRRLTRDFFFPTVQCTATILIAYASTRAGLQTWIAVGWSLMSLTCIAILDLASPQSLIVRTLFRLGKRLGLTEVDVRYYADKLIVFSVYPPTTLAPFYPWLRAWVPFTILALAWWLAWVLGWQSGDENFAMRLIALLLLLYGLIPFRIMIVGVMKHQSRPLKNTIRRLSIICAIGGSILIFWQLIDGTGLLTPIIYGIVGLLTVLAVYIAVFIAVRLDIGKEATGRVIRELSMRTLATPYQQLALADVAEMIGTQLRYERAFILEPEDGTYALRVTGTYGDKTPLGVVIPLEDSISGKAYQRGEAVVWNDVTACPYVYARDADNINGAEMAIPIKHQGNVFGVLNVQSKRENVFTPSDLRALDTVATLIGAMLALQERERFFTEAVELWQQLAEMTSLTNEEAVVRTFTTFVYENLFADIVIYYPLTLSGRPIRQPHVVGLEPDCAASLRMPHDDVNCFLLRLIEQWEPEFAAQVPERLPQGNSDVYLNLLRDEQIYSGCFIPIGSPQERLGALLLCFKRPTTFDAQRQFTVLSLAQTLAKEVAQLRYFNIFHRGPGRPDLGLHNLIGRRGVKGKIRNSILKTTLPQSQAQQQAAIAALRDALCDIDTFIDDALSLESAIPPFFQRENLEKKLIEHGGTLTPRKGERRPDIRYSVDDAVEGENHWIKLVLYRVATEAMNNAVFHGEASCVSVTIQRGFDHIRLEITNSGKPLPANASENRSRSGIYALVEQCERDLGATACVTSLPDHDGARVTVTIPMLPLRRTNHV